MTVVVLCTSDCGVCAGGDGLVSLSHGSFSSGDEIGSGVTVFVSYVAPVGNIGRTP
jgi:hypothetical protein